MPPRLPTIAALAGSTVCLTVACGTLLSAAEETDQAPTPTGTGGGRDGGDGVLVPEDSGTGTGTSDAGTATTERIVFVTIGKFPGDAMNGTGGDARCNAEAQGSILPRVKGATYKAWLSESTRDAKAQVPSSTVPFKLPKGEVLAKDSVQLIQGDLDHRIDQDQNGVTITGPEKVWTGTNEGGVTAKETCKDWTSAGGKDKDKGKYGQVDKTDTQWTAAGEDDCGTPHRLYCIEQ